MLPEEVPFKKAQPEEIAKAICGGIEQGERNIFPDEMSRRYFAENPIKISYIE
jgi:hypothetical protein